LGRKRRRRKSESSGGGKKRKGLRIWKKKSFAPSLRGKEKKKENSKLPVKVSGKEKKEEIVSLGCARGGDSIPEKKKRGEKKDLNHLENREGGEEENPLESLKKGKKKKKGLGGSRL